MKIGIDIRTLMDETYSGIPEYSYNIVKEILSLDKKNEYFLYYNSFKDLSSRIPDFRGENVNIVKTNYPSKVFNYIMQKGLARPKLNRLLPVDVFFMPHINFASFDKDAKKIITVHDLSFLIHPRFFSLKKNIWHKLIDVKRFLKQFDKIIAISKNTKYDLIEYCGVDEGKIELVYSGISSEYKKIDKNDPGLAKLKKKYKTGEKFILYLGTIEPRKNIDGIIRAYESLLNENKDLRDYKLVLAGAYGWKYANILNTWNRSRYKDKIIFSSYIDKKEKVLFYNAASIFVYPSFYEGFGFPPLEAMSCGLPVVMGANSSLSELIDDASVFVDPYDINSIKRGMFELLKDVDIRLKLAEKSRQSVEKYTWNETAKKTLEILTSKNV